MENMTIRTPDGGMSVTVKYRIIALESAITSDHPQYNQALQPRNRDTVSSRAQIQKIALDIHPELLLESYTTDTGAPVVDNRLQVISGNGRTLSLLSASGIVLRSYFSAVRNFAGKHGIKVPDGIDLPFLVREIVDPDIDLAMLAELSNRDNKLRRTDAEQAESDAQTIIRADLLPVFNPGEDGEILVASNADFLNGFIFASGDESLRNSDGSISSSAELRVKRAILACIFEGQKNSRIIIQKLIENATGTGLKRQIDGVISAAAGLLKIAANPDYAAYDLRGIIAESFADLLEYKKELLANPKLYKTIADYLDQGDMFEARRPAAVELLTTVLFSAKSVKAIRESLNAYSEAVGRIDPNTDSLFGFADESREDILFRLLDPENRIERRRDSDIPVPAVSIDAPETSAETADNSEKSGNTGNHAGQRTIAQETPGKRKHGRRTRGRIGGIIRRTIPERHYSSRGSSFGREYAYRITGTGKHVLSWTRTCGPAYLRTCLLHCIRIRGKTCGPSGAWTGHSPGCWRGMTAGTSGDGRGPPNTGAHGETCGPNARKFHKKAKTT